MNKLALVLAALLLLLAPAAFAQPEPAAAPAPSAAAGDQTSAWVVGFFEGMAKIATETKDCAKMGETLNNYLNVNEKQLRDAAYSDSVAPPEEEMAIMNAATALGEAAGMCYEEPSVGTFMERFAKLSADLDM